MEKGVHRPGEKYDRDALSSSLMSKFRLPLHRGHGRPRLTRRLILFTLGVLALLSMVALMSPGSPEVPLPVYQSTSDQPIGRYWSSYASISNLFVFGHSWSSYGVKVCEAYEVDEPHPYGNPDFPGKTTSNGPNWVGYMTHVYNRSSINTYPLAIPGATVDRRAISGAFGWDLDHQVHELIDVAGVCQLVPKTWDPATALFAVFLGVNDIMSCNEYTECDINHPPFKELFQYYEESLASLHAAGARNFLLLNCPPIDGPTALDLPSGSSVTKAQSKAIKSYNKQHSQLADRLRTEYNDTTVFEFDLWALIRKIVHAQYEVPEVEIYKNLTDPCWLYPTYDLDMSKITSEVIEQCGGLMPEEYLWSGAGHVTWPAHKAIARGVVEVMNAHDRDSQIG